MEDGRGSGRRIGNKRMRWVLGGRGVGNRGIINKMGGGIIGFLGRN